MSVEPPVKPTTAGPTLIEQIVDRAIHRGYEHLFPTRLALRLDEPAQVDMVLGEGVRQRGARADEIPEATPGVVWAKDDGRRDPVRFRAFHVTDADLDDLSAYVTAAPVDSVVEELSVGPGGRPVPVDGAEEHGNRQRQDHAVGAVRRPRPGGAARGAGNQPGPRVLAHGRRPRKTPRALSPKERADWLAKLDDDPVATRKDLPDLCRFMLATGVRIGEALAVTWPDVDLDAMTVTVNFTIVRIKGRGLVRKSTKSEAGERTLPLPSWAVTMLRTRLASADDPSAPVFPDSLGGFRDPSNTRRDLRAARGTGDYAWVTSHVFRKTAATVMDDADLPARVIADQLGHARPSMTQDVYLGRRTVDRRTADALETITAKGQAP